MSAENIYGTIHDGGEIEDAVIASLKEPWRNTERSWFGRCLDIVAEQRGRPHGIWDEPKSWESVSDFEKLPEDDLPCVIVVVPEVEPRKIVRGTKVSVQLPVAIVVIVSARGQRSTRRLGMRYGAAVQLAMTKRPTLPGLPARIISWEGQLYGELDFIKSRNMHAVRNEFIVECDDWITLGASEQWDQDDIPPDEDNESPHSPDWPVAEHTEVGVSRGTSDDDLLTPDVTHSGDDDEEDGQ